VCYLEYTSNISSSHSKRLADVVESNEVVSVAAPDVVESTEVVSVAVPDVVESTEVVSVAVPDVVESTEVVSVLQMADCCKVVAVQVLGSLSNFVEACFRQYE